MTLSPCLHAIITGGSSGIGKATAMILASKGYHITIIARREKILEHAVLEIKSACQSSAQNVLGLSADVSDKHAIQSAISKSIETIGPPSILITSAGIVQPGYFENLSEKNFEETMKINYFGTLYAIQAIQPIMKERKSGHIVIISSGAGLMGIFGYTSYCASKFAVRGLAEALRGEMKRYGINVSIAYPPDTDTPQLAEENKTKPAETKLITESGGVYSAHYVANAIVKGIQKNKFIISPGIQMALLARLHSFLNPILNYYFDHLIKRKF